MKGPDREDGEYLVSKLPAFPSVPASGHSRSPPVWNKGVEHTLGATGLRQEEGKPRLKQRKIFRKAFIIERK